jgi:hypothetical protein
MIIVCEQCEKPVTLTSQSGRCIALCSCGAKYQVDLTSGDYWRIETDMNIIFQDIDAELLRANTKYASEFNSMNEALGTLYAEFTELKTAIVAHSSPERIREEAIQVAAMAVKLAQYLDREQGGRL